MFRIATSLLLLPMLCGCNSQTPTTAPPTLTATVISYEPNAEWDHFEDGSFATYDHLRLKLDSEDSFSVAVSPDDLPDDSPLRRSGTRFTFTLTEPLDTDTHLAWGAFHNPTIID
ncbi:hypothetical protein Pla52o_07640 [Novipirellula galeiformis]|uniref:Uncharacterized protein n=2 Tax=Novipirellula galeiformis TaxID=2528004 RepID=A0A5C6CRB5_9BACT|nr:hypothetical protein Pla52o_07640 [Novipirellula galeiformis]